MLDRKGQRVTVTHDAVGRITSITRPDATARYRYDAVGRLLEIDEGTNNRITVDYDVLDRPAKETHVQGDLVVTIEHAWDSLDRRTRRTVKADGPGGSLPAQTTDYAYDDAGRITRITQQGQVTTYAWDADNRLTGKMLPNGIGVTYTYDDAGQVTDIAYGRSDGTLIERVSYQYDAAGRRIQKDTLVSPGVDETPFNATYDAANRMTAITLNPASASPTTYSLTYDSNGNLAERRNSTNASDLTTYSWDSRNRLKQLQTQGLTASFVYDSIGRRTQRTITRAGEPPIVTQFVYDGLQAVGEIRLPAGTVTAQSTSLITGLNLDEMIARIASGPNGSNPQIRTYLGDALNSVILQTRQDQSIQSIYGYSPYGQTFAGNDDEGNAVEYTGRENDETGLLFYRARFYDPVLKRFVSEDPIGLRGGINTYAYVHGNPLSYTDPLGLQSTYGLPWVMPPNYIPNMNPNPLPPGCACPSSNGLTPGGAIGGAMGLGAGVGAAAGVGVGLATTGAHTAGAVGLFGTVGALTAAGHLAVTGLVIGTAAGAVGGLIVAGGIIATQSTSSNSCPVQCPPCPAQ